MASIQFLGAAGTVTGSRHLLEHEGHRVLLDCGLFQGEKELRLRNWAPFPVPPGSIEAVVLSHAHIDHTGWLPGLVRDGFTGKAFCTPATRDLAAIMLPDSGRLQEEEAEFANRRKYSKHTPALPLYTEEDAVLALRSLRPMIYGEPFEVAPGVRVTFHRAGHILGSATVRVDLTSRDGATRSIVFTGDLGRYDTPILADPEPVSDATTLIMECTYGDRQHEAEAPRQLLLQLVREAIARNSVLLVPAFAIGRTQDVLYHLRQLQLAGELPSLPIFVDSPMACDATPLYLAHREDHDPEMQRELMEGRRPLQPSFVEFARSVEESKALNGRHGPMIIISASGMATGGRVLHHLAQRLPDPNTIVVFTGYQAGGTRGRKLLEGVPEIRIHGVPVTVKARITQIRGFSAHADSVEMDRWLEGFRKPPAQVFCVHGEAGGLEATRARLTARGWSTIVPKYLEKFDV
jgi:metallo-beta-lactamase family protein